jgi:hypothetical protein
MPDILSEASPQSLHTNAEKVPRLGHAHTPLNPLLFVIHLSS